jgi:hypothetical protein
MPNHKPRLTGISAGPVSGETYTPSPSHELVTRSVGRDVIVRSPGPNRRHARVSGGVMLYREPAYRHVGVRLKCVAIFTGLVVMTLASFATSSLAAPPEPTRLHAGAAAQPIRFPFLQWLRRVARQHVQRKIELGEFRRDEALDALQHWSGSWDHSGGEQVHSCSRYLPAHYFCAPLQRYYHFGVGYAISWKNSPSVAWSSPTWPRRVRSFLDGGKLYWLSCTTLGDTLWVNQYLRSNRWYRLAWSGYYVNRAWLYTGTNDTIRPC